MTDAKSESEAYQEVKEFIDDLQETGHRVARVTVPQDMFDELKPLADDSGFGTEIDGVGLCWASPDTDEIRGEVYLDEQ